LEKLESYREKIKQIKAIVNSSQKDASKIKRLKNELIRELAPQFRQTRRQDYFELLIKVFERAMNSAVFAKIPAQDRDDVLAEIHIAILDLAMRGVRQSTHFPLEDIKVDQVAYINRVIANTIYDYHRYPRRPAQEPEEEQITEDNEI